MGFKMLLNGALLLAMLPCFANDTGEGRVVESREGQVRKAQERQATTGEHQVRTDSEHKAEPRVSNQMRTPVRTLKVRRANPQENSRFVEPRRYRRRPTNTRYRVHNYFERRFDTNGDGYLSLPERERMVAYVHRTK